MDGKTNLIILIQFFISHLNLIYFCNTLFISISLVFNKAMIISVIGLSHQSSSINQIGLRFYAISQNRSMKFCGILGNQSMKFSIILQNVYI